MPNQLWSSNQKEITTSKSYYLFIYLCFYFAADFLVVFQFIAMINGDKIVETIKQTNFKLFCELAFHQKVSIES